MLHVYNTPSFILIHDRFWYNMVRVYPLVPTEELFLKYWYCYYPPHYQVVLLWHSILSTLWVPPWALETGNTVWSHLHHTHRLGRCLDLSVMVHVLWLCSPWIVWDLRSSLSCLCSSYGAGANVCMPVQDILYFVIPKCQYIHNSCSHKVLKGVKHSDWFGIPKSVMHCHIIGHTYMYMYVQ